jgi:hypothetical protein
MDLLQILQISHIVIMFFLIFFTKIQDSNKDFLLAASIACWYVFSVVHEINNYHKLKEENENKADLVYCEAYSIGKQKFHYINPYVEKESSDAFREGYIKGFKE